MEPITRRETLLNQIADNTSGNAGSIDMEPITREEVYLKQIADNTASGGGGGGSDLPEVTSEDNGDVLTVVDGAWDKAAPSGGSDLPDTPAQDGTYTLTNTVSSGSGTLAWGAGDIIVVHDTDTLDKTWQEIHDYLAAGKVVISVFEGDAGRGEVIQYVFTSSDFEQDVYKLFGISAVHRSLDIAEYDADSADDYPVFV